MSELTRYPSYKDSGVPWLGEIPSHWHVNQLKFSTTCNDEVLSANTDEGYEILYIDISSVSLTKGILNKESLTFEQAPSRARRVVRDGDILVSTVRTYLKSIAHVEKAEENLIASTGFAVLRPISSLSSKFLGYWIQSQGVVGSIMANSVGVSYPAINSTDLVRLPIVSLDILEQELIVAFLDKQLVKIDTIINKQKLLIEKLSEQRQSIITHTMTNGLNPNAAFKYSSIEWLGNIPEHWEVKSSRYVLSQVGSGKTPRGGAEVYTDEGVILIRSQNVHDDGLRLNDVAHITDEADNQQSNSRVLPDDVLLNITGASIGRANIVPKTFPRANVNQHVCILRPIEDSIYPQFLLFLLQSTYSNALIQAEQNGTSREGINFEQIRSFKYPIPPLEEQKQIIGYLNTEIAKIEQMTNATKKIVSSLKEYRSTLITQAVTGKIDVRQFEDNQKGAA